MFSAVNKYKNFRKNCEISPAIRRERRIIVIACCVQRAAYRVLRVKMFLKARKETKSKYKVKSYKLKVDLRHDNIGSFLRELYDPCGKSNLKKQSQFGQTQDFRRKTKDKNIENKANFNLGKIDVSSFLTSIYERLWESLCFFVVKNKANSGQTQNTRLQTSDYILKINSLKKLEKSFNEKV
jgi:hypothetical protein